MTRAKITPAIYQIKNTPTFALFFSNLTSAMSETKSFNKSRRILSQSDVDFSGLYNNTPHNYSTQLLCTSTYAEFLGRLEQFKFQGFCLELSVLICFLIILKFLVVLFPVRCIQHRGGLILFRNIIRDVVFGFPWKNIYCKKFGRIRHS